MGATVHFLNTKPGDCTIIQHATGHVTMMDICDGNDYVAPWNPAYSPVQTGQRSNFRICGTTTNPIAYAKNLGINSLFRFILSHPDMDHMDGFNKLLGELPTTNYWDSGARRPKPEFGENCPYLEADWDRYANVINGNEANLKVVQKIAGARFPFANLGENGESVGGDGLYILAPDENLLNDPDLCDDINEGSYVILYRSMGGRVLLPGDAHDAAWEYIRATYATDVRNCSFMLAPHHGRDSGRSYDFLDVVRPKVTLLGCAPCECIDYDQWYRRNLRLITSNQCGNLVLQAEDNKITMWVQNVDFAISDGYHVNGQAVVNSQGYAFIGSIDATAE